MSDSVKVNQIQSQNQANAMARQSEKAQQNKQNQEITNEVAASTSGDTVELTAGEKFDTGIYTIDQKEIDAIKQDFAKNVGAFKAMVSSMLEKQGLKFTSLEDLIKALKNEDGESSIKVDAETQQAAQEAISEDGYWGVKKTSERILNFAKALSGGDPDKIELLKGAFEDGFGEAKKVLGDELPDITQQTYDAVMEGFDKWANESAES
ncbi:hypothetical protein Q5O24_13775 [Eubacteriaceae bacterium ES3]|nr:hypothetical protein Q5O24_13775 [Eubacteriaceae bacterium ES3]